MAKPQAPVGAPKMPTGTQEHRERLEALRDALTLALEGAGTRELAPLAGQLRAVLNDLAALPAPVEVSVVDDIASQRARRRAAASAS